MCFFSHRALFGPFFFDNDNDEKERNHTHCWQCDPNETFFPRCVVGLTSSPKGATPSRHTLATASGDDTIFIGSTGYGSPESKVGVPMEAAVTLHLRCHRTLVTLVVLSKGSVEAAPGEASQMAILPPVREDRALWEQER